MSEANTMPNPVTPPVAAPAAATPPAPAPAATGGSSGSASTAGAGAGNAPQWFDSFQNKDVKDFMLTKKFETPEMLADSYRHLESMKGVPADQLLKLPTEPGSPEWHKVFEKLGKPQDPNGYGLEAAKDIPGSAEFTEWAKQTFHKANLTKDQARMLNEGLNQFTQTTTEAQKTAHAARMQAETEGLKAEWGNAYEQNLNIMKAGAQTFGVDSAKFDAIAATMGVKETFKLFQNIGSKLGEATFVNGQPVGGTHNSPEVAQAQIKAHLADPDFAKAYSKGSVKEKATMDKLFRDAYPGETTI